MKTVYKYEFEVTDYFTLEMPSWAVSLCVKMQGQTPCLWALVDTESKKIYRSFMIVGTGNPITEKTPYIYVDTFMEADGALVWHVFELVSPEDAMLKYEPLESTLTAKQ